MRFSLMLCFFFVLSIVRVGYSQGNPISADSFKELKKRPLLVQLVPKIKESEETKEVNKLIESFNSALKKYLEEYWFEETELIYKTAAEIAKIRKSGTTKYGVMYLSTFNRAYKSEFTKDDFHPENEIRIINYAKIETKNNVKKYSFYMTDLGENTTMFPLENDVKLSIKLLVLHLKEIAKSGKKLYSFQKYCKDQANLNCKEIKSNMLYINKLLAFKMALTGNKRPLSIGDYKKALKSGNVQIISNEEISKKIISNEENIVGIPIPEYIGVGNGISRKLYYRIFVNSKSGKIYSYAGSTSTDNSQYFSAADMKAVAKCR